MLKLASARPQYPEATVIGVAGAGPETLFAAFHFFPFGAFVRTVAWATAIKDGRFAVHSSDHLAVTD